MPHRRFLPALMFALMLLPWAAACPAEPLLPLVDAPESVGVGQPFLLRLSCPAPLAGVSVTWNGSTVEPDVTMEGGGPGGHGTLVLLGTRLKDEPGDYPLDVRALVQGRPWSVRRTVRVVPHEYQHETLSVAPGMVTPPQQAEERIQAEREKMLAAIRTVSSGRRWNAPFSLPVKGRMLSRYGLHRVFNGETKARHKGLDFRAWLGTPVRSIAAGTVVLTGNFYYGGNCVLVDHGEGVVSSSAHLSKMLVREGESVACGQVIGLSGATGRVTGPHLHLSVFVQGCNVDPEPLFSMHAGSPAQEPKQTNAQ